MFINEQFSELKQKFSALETSFNSTKTDYDASVKKITALETQVTDLTKVKSELEDKIKTLTDDPNITAKVQELTKQNGEFKTQVESLTKEKEEVSAKIINLEKEVETKANVKASEIIANGKVQSPLPITADIQTAGDILAKFESLTGKEKSAFYTANREQILKATGMVK